MIEFKSISKTFGRYRALNGIDLQLSEEKTHAILGLSGSGKSTLLRVLLNVVPPDSGEVLWNGESVTAKTSREWALSIGYVPQEGGLFPHLTAARNISLLAKIHGWSDTKIEDRLSELYPLFSLEQAILNRYPAELSGGQRQRVSVLRSLFLNPQLVVLDEPLGALDPITRSELQTELRKIFETLKKTVIIVTHDVGEAAYFGHTITLLNKGTVEQTGSLREFRETPKSDFVTQFMNAQRTLHDLDPQ